MTLAQVVGDLGALDEQATIYAAEPWVPEAEALVALEPNSGLLPDAAAQRGLRYFIQVSIARDLIEDWLLALRTAPALHEKCLRLIAYAVHET